MVHEFHNKQKALRLKRNLESQNFFRLSKSVKKNEQKVLLNNEPNVDTKKNKPVQKQKEPKPKVIENFDFSNDETDIIENYNLSPDELKTFKSEGKYIYDEMNMMKDEVKFVFNFIFILKLIKFCSIEPLERSLQRLPNCKMCFQKMF